MKSSIIIILFFIGGLLCGIYNMVPDTGTEVIDSLSVYALYLLLFIVGISMGGDTKTLEMLKSMNAKIVLVPLSIIAGTLIGAALFSFILKGISLRESMAVVSGFGYYSLSSIVITKLSGEKLGVIALLSNISREIITLLITPLLVKFFGKLAPVASGGATSMDTTLPIIVKYTGKEYAVIAIFSGVVLTLVVPIIIPFILS